MVDDLDICRSAKLLIDQHGEDAATEAAMRADAMLEKGAMAGEAKWQGLGAGGQGQRRDKCEQHGC